jgi:hypothetical protein
MPAGSKVRDTKQEYQFSQPFITPSGHEISVYDTPGNARVVIKHTSGSHIEFKDDGTVYLKSVGDIHTHSSVISSQENSDKGSDTSTLRVDTDYAMHIGGRLNIKCSELNFEIGSTGRIIAGTDLITSANNIINKATESISLEGTKSIYMDTKEMRDRIVSRRSEVGTKEDGTPGGINVMNVYGNAIIQNDDPNGGITISSKGYLNLVCGQERVDITGRWTDRPSMEARATYTNKVYTPMRMPLDMSIKPGDYYEYIQTTKDVVINLNENQVVGGLRTREVGMAEFVNIGGIQVIRAAKIFLN